MADSAQTPQQVLEPRTFCREKDTVSPLGPNATYLSGFSSDGVLAWTVTDSSKRLEVWETGDGSSAGSWSSSPVGSITCVEECIVRDSGTRLFLVGVSKSDQNCGLAIVQPSKGTLLRLVDLDFVVSSIHCLTNDSEAVPAVDAGHFLRYFKGAAVLGGHGGIVLLVDLQFDQLTEWLAGAGSGGGGGHGRVLLLNNQQPRTTEMFLGLREQALARDEFLTYDLTKRDRETHVFRYCNADATNSVLMEVAQSKTYVSLVRYIPQLLTLFIGYNFGGFQLYNIRKCDLVCSSKIDNPTALEAVSFVAYQEPEDDPRYFVYLWVVYGPHGYEYKANSRSRIVLYQLNYQDRERNADVAFVYRHLQGCQPRFEHHLSSDPRVSGDPTAQGGQSQVLVCKTLSEQRRLRKTLYQNEEVLYRDMTLTAFVWTTQYPGDPTSLRAYVALFDLNQWYHSQMLSKVVWRTRKGPGERSPLLGCGYFAFFALVGKDRRLGHQEVSALLNCHIWKLRQLRTPPPAPEIHLWPSSLAFEALVLTPIGVTALMFLGVQRTVLHKMTQLGPEALSNPAVMDDLFNQARIAELHGTAEVADNHIRDPRVIRMALLDLCLENGLLSVLEDCIAEWSNAGLDPNGCTLLFLLEWAWSKLCRLKDEKDKMCETVLDHSLYQVDHTLDPALVSQLYHYSTAFLSLSWFFETLYKASQELLEERGRANTQEGEVELLHKAMGAQFHAKYIRILLWAFKNNLLPFPFPPSKEPLQLPDGNFANGPVFVREMLSCVELDEKQTTDYPPPAIEVLFDLQANMVTDLPDYTMMYYLYDVMQLNGGIAQDLAASYQQCFQLPKEARLAVRGLWLLDSALQRAHLLKGVDRGSVRDMGEEALSTLKKANVALFENQHALVLRVFMDIGYPHLALEYFDFFRAFLPLDMDHYGNIEIVFELLATEGQLVEALQVCRSYECSEVEDKYYEALLLACRNSQKLSMLVYQELKEEEAMFVWDYLETQCADVQCKELLVLALLHWGYYHDAQVTNEAVMRGDFGLLDSESFRRGNERRVILTGIMKCDPSLVSDLSKLEAPAIKEVEPETLTAVIAKEIRPRSLTTARLLQGIIRSRPTPTATPTTPHQRKSMGGALSTPRRHSIGNTPLRGGSSFSALGQNLLPTVVEAGERRSVRRVLTPKPTSDAPEGQITTNRMSVTQLRTRLVALGSSFNLPSELRTPSMRTPSSLRSRKLKISGGPTPRSILKRPIPTQNQDEVMVECDGTNGASTTRRITFAKISASSASTVSLSASPSPLQGPGLSPVDSSGEDTFADASDRFPSPEGNLRSVAHALKYSEAVDSIAEDIQPAATDRMDTGEGEGQVDEAHPSSLIAGASGLSRAPLKDSSASPEVGDTRLHLSLESGEEESPQRHSREEEADRSFLKSSLEEDVNISPPLARQTLRRTTESQSAQMSSFWQPRKTTVSLSSPLFRHPSAPSSQQPTTTVTLKTYRFISEGMRETMLSPLFTHQPTPPSNPPSNTSTPRRSTHLASSSARQPLASVSSSTYSFSPPVAISPPPSAPLEGNVATTSEETVKPFVFSPPFTRSASTERKSLEFSRTTPMANAAGKRRKPKARHSSAEESEGVATRRREREKGTRGDGSLGEVQRRSPVPVRRSKRLLTKKTSNIEPESSGY